MVVSLLLAILCLVLGQYRYIRLQQKKTERLLAEVRTSQKRAFKKLKAQIKPLKQARARLKRLEVGLSTLPAPPPDLSNIELNLAGLRHQSASVPLLASVFAQWLSKRGTQVLRNTNPGRIGHFAGETDLWAKQRILSGKDCRRCALIGDAASVSNPHLWSYWNEYFEFTIPQALWESLLSYSPKLKQLEVYPLDYFLALNATAECYQIYNQWGDRPPLLKLREEDRIHGLEVMRGWGMKEDDWFVCIHNREKGYSPVDDHYHDYRNASIESYIPAIQEITARGGWVIRMGDPAMTPLPKLDRVIDYAHLPEKSARLDVVFCAMTRFFLGTSSGLFVISTTFGVPVASANFVPMSALQFTFRDVGMPMLHADTAGSLLPFAEIMATASANFRKAEEYQKKGIRVLNNSPDEILGLTREMLDRASGTCQYTEDDEDLQRRFHSLFKLGHYGYGSAARTSREFLRKHRDLLM